MTPHCVFLLQTWQCITLLAMHSGAPHGLPCTTVAVLAGKTCWSFCQNYLCNLFIILSALFSHPSCLTHRGEVINGGFGLLLDGSEEAAKRASLMLNWDVSNGVRVCSHELASVISGCRWLLTGSRVFLCAAGGSSMLVWKLQCLWDYPAHHGGEQTAVCHHAFSCTGWVRAGSRPAGLACT